MQYEKTAKKHGFAIVRQIEAVSTPGVYLAQKGQSFFILKSPDNEWSERAALQVWSGGPSPVFQDLGEIIALEYLSGRTPYYWSDDDLPKLVRMFQQIEKNQPDDPSPFKPLSHLLDIIAQDLKESDIPYREEAVRSLHQADDQVKETSQLIHGDLHPWNIFMRDRATLIDPYGLLGDPGFDLAFLAAGMAHDQEEFLEKMNKELGYAHAETWFPAMVARRLNNTLRLGQVSESRIAKKLARRVWG